MSGWAKLAVLGCVVASIGRAEAQCQPHPYVGYGHGDVMTNSGQPFKVYVIFYGKFPIATDRVIRTLINNIGGTPYLNMLTAYDNSTGRHVPNGVVLAGTRVDEYQHGKSFDDDQAADYLSAAVKAGWFPEDADAVYAMFFAEDVAVSHRGSRIPSSSIGAYHTWTGRYRLGHLGNPSHLHYAVIAHPRSNPTPRFPGAEDLGAGASMAFLFAHEFAEAVTDPENDGYQNDNGKVEIADVCSACGVATLTFGGTTYALPALMTFDHGDRNHAWCGTSYPCEPTNECAGKSCGDVVLSCGRPISCGTCRPGQTCGLGAPNQCGCEPLNCQGRSCGTIADACGHSRSCGTCPSGELCLEGECKKSVPPPKCPCGGTYPGCHKCE